MMAEPTKEALEVCAAQMTPLCQRRKGLAHPKDGYLGTLVVNEELSVIWLCDSCAFVLKSRRKLA